MIVRPHIRHLRFAVNLKRRAAAMKAGRHCKENALVMQLAASLIASLSSDLEGALSCAEEAMAKLDRRDTA